MTPTRPHNGAHRWGSRPTAVDGAGVARLQRLARNRHAWMVVDLGVWVAAVACAAGLRRLYVFTPISISGLFVATVVAAVAHVVLGAVTALYSPARVRGAYDEVVRLGITVATSAVVLLVLDLASPRRFVPGTVPVVAGVIALGGMLAGRVLLRAVQARRRAWRSERNPVLVVGAGDDARALVADLRATESSLSPVAVLNGAGEHRAGSVHGLRVVRGDESVADVAGRTGARTVVIADPTAEGTHMRRWTLDGLAAGLPVLVVPTEFEAPRRTRGAESLRPVDLGHLLGRRSVVVDDEALTEAFSGRTVLVTGAGGTMGRALTLDVLRHGAARVVLLDRDESAVNASMLDLAGRGLDGPPSPRWSTCRTQMR